MTREPAIILYQSPLPLLTRTIPFTFTDQIVLLDILIAPQSVCYAGVKVLTVFDGITTSLKFGSVNIPDKIIKAGDVLLSKLGQYEFHELIQFESMERLILTVNPGQSRYGSALLFYSLKG